MVFLFLFVDHSHWLFHVLMPNGVKEPFLNLWGGSLTCPVRSLGLLQMFFCLLLIEMFSYVKAEGLKVRADLAEKEWWA